MVTPVFSDAISVVALQKIAVNTCVKATFNISNKFCGWLFVRAMRLSSSAPAAGIIVVVRKLLTGTPAGGAGTVNINHPGPVVRLQDSVTASNLTTLNGTPTVPGSTVILTSATGFAGDQLVGIVDSTTTPTIFEVGRTTKISGTTLTFDESITNTAVATGATITNNLFCPAPIYIDGSPGANDIEIVFDNGLEGTVAYAIECWAQSLNSVG